jgi:predicted transcriptional regulator of viral defense system
MAKTRFDIAKKDIVSYFESNPSKIYTFNDISEAFKKNRQFWRLSTGLTVHKFINLLKTKTKIKELKFEFPTITLSRYIWGEVPIFSIVLTLKPESYFTHYTAMYIHELTEQMPRSIFLNFEQQKHLDPGGSLEQGNIDKAFSRPPRVTNTIANIDDYTVYLLNGKHTGRLGVIDYYDSAKNKLYVTNIERTLIDITVRPTYSGGVSEILKAYERAAGRVSINKLSAMLADLNYIYPYHQAIGFYLERAGAYKKAQIDLMDQIEKKHDFYLAHQMKEVEYSEKWKLYYPKNF